MIHTTPFLLDRLRNAVAQRLTTQSDIAVHTGVDQSQVSRILAGKSKRMSENVQALCKYALTLPTETTSIEHSDDEAFELLAELLRGNPETKQSVITLMRNLLVLKRQYENNNTSS